jgi:tetratricopeptide (TPR) repeat protein
MLLLLLLVSSGWPYTAGAVADESAWKRYMTQGDTAFEQGQHTEAESWYLQALKLLADAGPEEPRLAVTLNTLAMLYHSQQQYSVAAPLYEQVLQLLQAVLPPGHPTLATTRNNLAVLYEAQGHYARAEPLYRQALDDLERLLGPEHANVAAALGNYADLLRKLQRDAEADGFEARARAIWAKQDRHKAR